jgi:hypothetical protein
MPTDYSKAKIYKLIDNTNGNIYVGSTCEPILSRRLAGHVGKYKAWQNGKFHYVTSFDIIKNSNYDIVLIEAFPCNSRDQLHKRERFFIESMKCVNKFIPLRTGKEYRLSHADEIKEYQKEYYLLNADEIKKQQKEYKKEYYSLYAEEIKKQQKEYRLSHVDEIKKQKRTIINCPCGASITKGSKAQHEKTEKHISYIANQNK